MITASIYTSQGGWYFKYNDQQPISLPFNEDERTAEDIVSFLRKEFCPPTETLSVTCNMTERQKFINELRVYQKHCWGRAWTPAE